MSCKTQRLKHFYIKRSSIGTRINILMFSTALLSLVSITAVFNAIYSSTIVNQAINDTRQRLQLISNNITLLTQSIENYSRLIITSKQTQSILDRQEDSSYSLQYLRDINELKGTFSNLIDRNNVINSIFIINLKNKHIYDIGSNTQDLSVEKIISQEDMHKLANSNDHFLWTDVHKSPYKLSSRQVNTLTLLEPIMNMGTGHVDGIIASNINESALSSEFSKMSLGKTGKFFLVNSKGIIMSSAVSANIYKDISSDPIFPCCLDNSQTAKVVKINGTDTLAISHTIDKLSWKVIGVVPIEELLEQKKKMNFYIIIIGILLFFLSISISFFFSTRITKPIICLAKLMSVTGIKGNLDTRVDENRSDEVGILLKSYNQMMARISELMVSIKEEKRQKSEYELCMINAQINPHFLYNALNSICGLNSMGEYSKATNMTKSLGKFYKLSLSNGKGLVKIREEIKLVESYINVQKNKFESLLDVCISVQPQILNCRIPKFSLQPLVENSFKHGFSQLSGRNFSIVIRGQACGDRVILSVEDNGKGDDGKKINSLFRDTCFSEKTGFGLGSIYTRLKIYFGSDFSIWAETCSGAGMKVTMDIPSGGGLCNDKSTSGR